jgi:hypothetical protein
MLLGLKKSVPSRDAQTAMRQLQIQSVKRCLAGGYCLKTADMKKSLPVTGCLDFLTLYCNKTSAFFAEKRFAACPHKVVWFWNAA